MDDRSGADAGHGARNRNCPNLKDDDEAWARVQRQIAEELTELQRALSALGHQAQADPSDWGFSVDIIYQNRREPPDRLAARLAEEIAQRSELLTANERTVLENHLQAEIAAEVQRLLQAAETAGRRHQQGIAQAPDLHRRALSPAVAAAVRGGRRARSASKRRASACSTPAPICGRREDRRVVGAMLQQRIAAERERADSGSGKMTAAACSTSSPARWTIVAGTVFASSAGRRGIGASFPAPPRAASGRSA